MTTEPGIINPSNETYRCCITSGEHGVQYQRNLYLLIFERLTRIGCCRFKMAYEMSDAGKFDDVVVFHSHNCAENVYDEGWFFQIKHNFKCGSSELNPRNMVTKKTLKQADTSILTYDMLFQPSGDFSLYKYLVSYSVISSSFSRKKTVFIFTNKRISSENIFKASSGRVKIVPRMVRDILKFGPHGKNVGLEVCDTMIGEIQEQTNNDFFKLRDAVFKLMQCGQVDPVIFEYKTPLAYDVFEKSNNIIRFRSTFGAQSNKPEVRHLYHALTQIGTEFNDFNINSKEIDTVREFFNDFVLSIEQPDDLRPIIGDDLEGWMKTWLRPDYFGKLDEVELQRPLNEFEILFNRHHINRIDMPYLTLADGRKCLKYIRELRTFNMLEFCPFYINRRIAENGASSAREINDDDFTRELTGRFDSHKLIILCADPGMGKTTILQYIAHEAQQIPHRLVYLIHLNELQHALKSIKNACDLESALSALNEVLSKMHRDYIEKAYKTPDEEHRRIVIFFDAFDEVHTKARHKVIAILDQLLSVRNVQIVVTGRKHVKELLEEQFGVNAMSLEPFKPEDQINFLKKFWNVTETDIPIFEQYAQQLLKLFHTTENRALYEFTGLPLALKMLAGVKRDDYKTFLGSNSDQTENILSQEVFGIVDLYETFVQKSFVIEVRKKYSYLESESMMFRLYFDNFILQHQLFAIKYLKMPFWKEVLMQNGNKSKHEEFLKNLKESDSKSPLVEVVNYDAQFVHLSYGEFFVAKFLYLNTEKFQSYIIGTSKDSWSSSLFVNFETIRRFYFAMLETKQDATHFNMLRQPFDSNERIREWVLEVHGCNTIREMLKNTDGSTKLSLAQELLIEAVRYDETFHFLIQTYGCELDVNYIGLDGTTALLEAAKHGSVKSVKLLFTYFADINIDVHDVCKRTPLHFSIYYINVTKFLLEKTADVEIADEFGRTPLLMAAEEGYVDVVKLLLEHKATASVEDNSGTTLAHIAISQVQRCKSSITFFTEGLDLDIKRFKECKSFFLELLKSMVEKLDDVSDANALGESLLHHAAREGVEEAVELLLNRSAEVNIQNADGQTPLHLAITNNHICVIKDLLEKSADVNVATKNGLTPLHLAARDGFVAAVKLLLKHKANLKAHDADGQTPVHFAISSISLCESKIRYYTKALENIRLSCSDDPEGDRIFCNYCIEENTNLLEEFSELLRLMIDNLEDDSSTNMLVETLLHHAASERVQKAVKLLLNHSASFKHL